MPRSRTALGLTALTFLVAGLLAGPASATSASEVTARLRTQPVYVDPDVTIDVDEAQVQTAIQDAGANIYVAVLPQEVADHGDGTGQVSLVIAGALDDRAVLFTLIGSTLTGVSGSASGLARGEAQSIVRSHDDEGPTTALVDSVRDAAEAAADGTDHATGDRAADLDSGSGLPTVLVIVGLLFAALIAGAAVLALRARSRRLRADEAEPEDVETLAGLLGDDWP